MTVTVLLWKRQLNIDTKMCVLIAFQVHRKEIIITNQNYITNYYSNQKMCYGKKDTKLLEKLNVLKLEPLILDRHVDSWSEHSIFPAIFFYKLGKFLKRLNKREALSTAIIFIKDKLKLAALNQLSNGVEEKFKFLSRCNCLGDMMTRYLSS